MATDKKVLIVDDDPDILEALKLMFESSAYQVKTTTRAEETYEAVKEFHPDAIILDVLLSGVDGRAVCQKLKSQPQTKDIPVIMVSAHPSAAQSTIAAGADDFIAKPFDMFTLIDQVGKYVGDAA